MSKLNTKSSDVSILLLKIKSWSSDVSNWLNKVETKIKKIYSIFNFSNKKNLFSDSEENIYKYIKDINFDIDPINIWINKTLKSYDKIVIDISNIQKFLISSEIKNFYEYTKIIERTMIFFNMLLPLIKKISNIKACMLKVIENTISNKKRNQDAIYTNNNKKIKLDLDQYYINKPDELLEITKYFDDKKYSKINVISTFNDILNYLQTNNLHQKLTITMQMRIEKFLRFLNELNDKDIICIKKLNDFDIKDICLGFNIIIIINKDEWIKAIEYNIEKKHFSAYSIYEMLSMFGYSSQVCKKKTDLSHQHLNKKVKILYTKSIWIYNDDTFLANIHRSWNSNIAGIDTIRKNKTHKKSNNGIDLILKAAQIER